MSTPNFKALLKKNLDEVKKPEPLPEGSYRGTVHSYQFGESSQKKTPYVEFFIVPQEAMEGVNEEELAAALQGESLTSKKLRSTFYITEEALFRVKEFLSSLGIDTSGRTLDECFPDTKGANVLFDVEKKPSQDGESFFNNIKSIKGEG